MEKDVEDIFGRFQTYRSVSPKSLGDEKIRVLGFALIMIVIKQHGESIPDEVMQQAELVLVKRKHTYKAIKNRGKKKIFWPGEVIDYFDNQKRGIN